MVSGDVVASAVTPKRFGDELEVDGVDATESFDLCRVAGWRLDPSARALVATGPDGTALLELVRTYA